MPFRQGRAQPEFWGYPYRLELRSARHVRLWPEAAIRERRSDVRSQVLSDMANGQP